MYNFAYPSTMEHLAKPQWIDINDSGQINALLSRHKLSKDEFEKILTILGRPPSLSELGVFSAMWSEHCSYKSSRVHLRRFPTTGPKVVVGPGENAGVVEIENGLCVAFKMESHNHPSYIEPYQGAATGVGGILRDVFCMGARPIANLNCLRFGSREHHRTGYIAPRVIKGIGDYGNCVGVPTVGGSVTFDETYNGNCLVNAMTVGLIDKDKIFKGFATGQGNYVVYVGSATGRDGVHGATMASDAFVENSDTSKTTIQVGDPFAEKLLMEATLEVLAKNLVVGIQDMGAAGLTSSSFEMAGRAGNGIFIDLDKVPVRAENMSAYEIMLSESQERMLMVITPEKWPDLREVLDRWQLPNAIIGVVTNTGRMQIQRDGVLEIDLPVAPLTDEAPLYERKLSEQVNRPADSSELSNLAIRLQSDHAFAADVYRRMLIDAGSKKIIFEQFDRHVGTKTVFASDHGGAAVLWLRTNDSNHSPYLGISISSGCNERRVFNNPRVGSAQAVRDCAREIVATGGRPLAVTDCLNFGNAEDPKVMRQFSDSVDGISEACRALGTPVISGNVSLYNATGSKSIYPTPMIGMVGVVDDIRQATPATVQNETDLELYELRPCTDVEPEFAAALVGKISSIGPDHGRIAEIDWTQEKIIFKALDFLRSTGELNAARPISEGGLGMAVIKMLSKLIHSGFDFEILPEAAKRFFGEGGSRFLVYVKSSRLDELQSALRKMGVELSHVATAKRRSELNQSLNRGELFGEMKTYFGRLSLKDVWLAYNSFMNGGVN